MTRLKKVLYSQLDEHADEVLTAFNETVARAIVIIDDVECVYEDKITKVASIMTDSLREVTATITTYDQWTIEKEGVLEELKARLLEE